MTLLQIVTQFCLRTGITAPSAVVGSSDPQVMQIQALLNEIAEDVSERMTWQGLVREATFVTVATESQGKVVDKAPEGFSSIINDTIVNRTTGVPLYGPIDSRAWQQRKATISTGPFHSYRIRGGELLFDPIPEAGQTCAFEYRSNYGVQAANGTLKTYFTADTDTTVVDPKLFLAGLRWKWKCEKGLPYAEEFNRYEEMLNNSNGRDATKPTLSMDSCSHDARPGIVVMPGSWKP